MLRTEEQFLREEVMKERETYKPFDIFNFKLIPIRQIVNDCNCSNYIYYGKFKVIAFAFFESRVLLFNLSR